MDKPIFSKNTIEFVTVALEFCSFMEQAPTTNKSEFTDTSLKLLPLLYLKATLLPTIEPDTESDDVPEQFVTEEIYNYIKDNISVLMGNEDAYLEVFQSEIQYSDTPITAYVSEDIADIYQDVKNFISIYRLGIEENMTEALYNCQYNFVNYWGQKLVNVMRPLHSIRYIEEEEEEFTETPIKPNQNHSILAQRLDDWNNENINLDDWNNER